MKLPEGKGRNVQEEIMVKNFPNVIKTTNLERKAYMTLRRINTMNSIPRNIMVKPLTGQRERQDKRRLIRRQEHARVTVR